MESIGEFEYSKKDLIGHGAFAVVFKGRHKKQKHDLTVAIKCITKKNLAKSQNLLSKEINILKELSCLKHDNVVALLDCKETSHHVYLVMEYCNGGDLADYLQAKGTLSEDTIASFLRQIAGAMRALNAKGIVHRDLKPQNILLCHPSGRPSANPTNIILKIADFGFARFLQDGVMAATLCGSPMYMAPEVIMSLQYDAKADLWSVGTIVYQCLTGRAPFQAQTPQQLKQFYERNANLQPNIPAGTSPELKQLLYSLLKRNAKDRIDFDEFFVHPFVNPPKSSSPVPVPRSRSRGSLAESPQVKAVSASPLSANTYASPPQAQLPPPPPPIVQKSTEPMDTGSITSEAAKVPRSPHPASRAGPAGTAEPEDYVMVPENLPSDHSAGSTSSTHRPPSSVDLNAIFSDASPESPRLPPRGVRVSPHSQAAAYRRNPEQAIPTPTTTSPSTPSPSRPSSLPGVAASPSSPVVTSTSQPIPVPSQVKAYEQIQRSMGGYSPSSPGQAQLQRSPAQTQGTPQSVPSPQGMPIPRKNSTGSIPSVSSMSPPNVQFTIGTPPSGTWRRSSSSSNMTPPSCSSPMRKQHSASPLPTILGSPTKVTPGFMFPTPEAAPPATQESPNSPLQTPFGNMQQRTKTCPDNIAAVGYNVECKSVVPVSMSMDRSSTDPGSLFKRSSSGGKLSDQLIKAAFGGAPLTSPQGPPVPQGASPSSNMMVPYGGSQGSLHHASPSSASLRDRAPSFTRQRRLSGPMSGEEGPASLPFTQSPPNMEGPITFVAPELAEETLMDKEHNDTVGKLNFILALVECIIEIAQSRSSPLSESVAMAPHTAGELPRPRSHSGGFTLEGQVCFVSEEQRRLEQLVLYVRSLQLLTSSIQLAREEMAAGRLQRSNTVKNILHDMNDYYHQCLSVCRNLHSKGVALTPDPSGPTTTADKLIYSHAIEMCQTAALDELFGNPQECFRRYRSAQILLHSLAQQAYDSHDRELLNKYKENVEKRLYHLHNQGYINTAYDNS